MAVYLGSNKVGVAIPGGGITPTGTISITENGTHDVTNYASANVNVSSGGGSIKSVKFFDYDGTILYSYTPDEFAALTAMPANPSHTGLVAQGWNWTLSDAQDYVKDWGGLNIGQMYTTSSGDTEIDIEFPLDSARLDPYLGIAVNGTVTIDWGDSSTPDTVTGTSLTTIIRTQHIYATTGNYTIIISVDSGSFAFYGAASSFLLSHNSSTANLNRVYANCVKAIRVGNDCKIEYYAFNGCYSLQSITIPNTITSIGVDAFYYCYSLQSVTIPNTVTSIGDNAFYNCYSLSSVTIPNTVTSIGNYIFEFCYSLQSVTIPDTITSISNYTFYNCYSLSSVTIPNTVTSISASAFYNCSSLQSITIPSTVTSIGGSAFYYCYSLQSVTIPSNVTSIGSSVFYGCYALSSVTIPSTVTSIGGSAFYQCYSLSSITLPNTLTSIGSSAFYRCYALSSVTIPNTVTSIAASTFRECNNLQSVTLPNNLTSIENYVFYSCYALSSITIPSTVTSIGSNAFYQCYALSTITIPSNVTSIGINAFNGCYGLKEIHIQATTPPTITNANVFSNLPSDCTIYVPSASLDTYKTTNIWSTWSSQMVGE